jgi:hypothetical protein
MPKENGARSKQRVDTDCNEVARVVPHRQSRTFERPAQSHGLLTTNPPQVPPTSLRPLGLTNRSTQIRHDVDPDPLINSIPSSRRKSTFDSDVSQKKRLPWLREQEAMQLTGNTMAYSTSTDRHSPGRLIVRKAAAKIESSSKGVSGLHSTRLRIV